MAAMEPAKLDLHGLPLETLQRIAGHLSDSHRPSLYAFGLASVTCHRATIPSIFHRVHLTVSSREALRRDVDTLAKTLSRANSARHVRCLSIKGSLCLSGESRIECYKSCTSDRHSWFRSTGVDEILDDEEPFYPSPHVVYDEPVIAKLSVEDMAWAPVVSFIKTLPCLTQLIYDCRNQFPPSLLDALHDHHPHCKLYHHTFRLRTLLWGQPYPYEMELSTSPCLYSVKIECGWRDSDGDDDFNQEAMMELVASLAPNLREVVVVNLVPENSWRYSQRPREPWQGLPCFVPGRSIGSLTSLSLVGAIDLKTPGLLQAWGGHTDFGSLRHLALGGGYGCENVGINDEMMEWISQNCCFPRLESLHIRLDRDDQDVERPKYVNNAIAFFRAFGPLQELSVSGPLEPNILDAILNRHGQTLKKLSLRPSAQGWTSDNCRIRRDIPMTFTKEHILRVQATCLALQELAVPVKRTKSDSLEAEIYKSFGEMERLQSLFLTLDCSNWRVTRDPKSSGPLFDNPDHETCKGLTFLKKGHLRETFLNCAVDETLVRSIWDTICQSKVGQPLESLKLWTAKGGQWGNHVTNGDIPNVINHLSRSWLVERTTRDDKDVINIRELGRRARDARDQKLTGGYEQRAEYLRAEKGIIMEPGDVAEDSEAVQVFRRVWPRKKGSMDWREDWSSPPLQA